MENIIVIILSSSVIASLITSYITKRINDKNKSLKYITEERKKWRKFIRKQISKLIVEKEEKKLKELIAQLRLNLNPNDKEDKKIISTAKKLLIEKENRKKVEEKLLELSSHLLKHDWERAKKEARFNFKPFFILILSFLVWGIINFFNMNNYSIKKLFELNSLSEFIQRISFIIIGICLIYYLYNLLKLFIEKISNFLYRYIINKKINCINICLKESLEKIRKLIYEFLNKPYRKIVNEKIELK